MAAVQSDAIILQAFPYSETSKILRLLTRTHGVRSAMAKGAQRPRSRFGGVLDPFTQGVATLHLKENRDLQTLSGFELTRARRGLGRDLVRFGGASLIAELVMRTGSEESQPWLFERVAAALDRIQDADPAIGEAVILAETWGLVSLLGFAPEVRSCVDCGRPLRGEEEGRFDFAAGGVRCSGCGHAAPGPTLPAHARLALLDLVQGSATPLGETAGHWQLLSRFLEYHVIAGGSLRSLAFIAEALAPAR